MRLEGLDGSSLLGFMAALGALRLADEAAVARGSSRPKLRFGDDYLATLDGTYDERGMLVRDVMQGLDERAAFYSSSLASIDKPTDFDEASFGRCARAASRWQRDALAGLACETGRGEIAESTLCAANGAGHQNLIRSIRDVLALVQPEHIDAALFRSWKRDYSVPVAMRKELAIGSRKPTLRLDPADERLYALRATDPTPPTSEYKTELGAQALAIPAFELLPVCPSRRPTCIASRASRGRVQFEWVLWQAPASISTVRALLAAGPQGREPMRARGAIAAFGAARVTGDNGKLSFAPTSGLW